ncbi:MAG: conserved membrane protein of unknown function [Promethearchaeota archaeon]|nr:MAG: conserved membrane protein of unknown function [Candidatus Lokiarchaeota archaeon]
MQFQDWISNPLNFLLENLEFLILGITTLLFVIVTLIISGKMIYRGIKLELKTISYVGIEYFGVASCWFGVTFNFIIILFFNIIPPWELHFIAHGGIVSIAQIFWVFAMTELLPIKTTQGKIIKILAIVFGLSVEILYIIIIFTNISWLGTPVAPIQIVYGWFSYIYLMGELIVFLSFGFWFVKESLRADDTKIRLKGKFLAFSFVIFTLASILEVFFQEIWIFVFARITVTCSAFFFYIGFLLPKKIENIFIK